MLNPEKNRIVVDGVGLAYGDSGSGRPVVFVHGFPASSFSWRQVAGELADCCRAVSIDMMGFGDSDKPWDRVLDSR